MDNVWSFESRAFPGLGLSHDDGVTCVATYTCVFTDAITLMMRCNLLIMSNFIDIDYIKYSHGFNVWTVRSKWRFNRYRYPIIYIDGTILTMKINSPGLI